MSEIKIIFPTNIDDQLLEIKELIKLLADESDNFPFTSDDLNMTDENLHSYLNFLIKSSNSTLIFAYANEALIALAYLEGGKKARTYHLANLGIGVLKSYCNNGVGSLLMESLISFSKESRYIAKIDLYVRSDNKAAIALYKSKGFVLEGKSRRGLFIDGIFYDMLYFGLLID